MNIFVAKISSETTSENLQELFGEFGEVVSAKIIMDRDTGKSKQYGFVEMSNDDEALAAIEKLNDFELNGRNIVVKKANPKPEGSKGNKGGFQRRKPSHR